MKTRCALFVIFLVAVSATVRAQNSDSEERFISGANEFAVEADLPLRLSSIERAAEVTPWNLRERAGALTRGLAFFYRGQDGRASEFSLLARMELPPEVVDTIGNELISRQLIQPGSSLVNFHWSRTDGGDGFQTVGTADEAGRIGFEPILYFNGAPSLSPGRLERGSWKWGPWRHTIENGFGLKCIEQEWTVRMETKDCAIVDPSPHVEITRQISNCWGWQQATVAGEQEWSYPSANCTSGEEAQEECIKWTVVAYVASGFSNIKVEAGAKAVFKGIELDSRVSFDSARLGSEATYETIRNLCALSGDQGVE